MKYLKVWPWGRFFKTGSLFLLVILLVGCLGIGTTTPQPTPTPIIQYSPIAVGIPSSVMDHTTKLNALPADTQMNITLYFNLSNTQKLQLQKVVAKDTSKQPAIGLDPQTLQHIEEFFGVSDVKLTVNKTQTSASFTAPARTVGKIFQTSFRYYSYQRQKFYAPVSTPMLPTLLAEHITSVLGLETYQPPLHIKSNTQVSHTTGMKRAKEDCDVSSVQGAVLPRQIASAYGYNQFQRAGLNGQGMTVDLVEIDGFDLPDIQNYADCVEYNTKNISVFTVDSAPKHIEGESIMDIEILMGLLRDVHINVYQTGAGIQGLGDIFNLLGQTKSPPGTVVSVSIGGAEDEIPKALLDAVNQEMGVLYNQNLSVFFASGDCAAFTDQIFGSRSVSFPASSPYVIGVGGTQLQLNASGGRGDEAAWVDPIPDPFKCDNSWGTGGGTSRYFSEPVYQSQNASGELQTLSLGFRNVPDVAANAVNVPVYAGGKWISGGGTSAAAPTWAAGMTLVNEGLLQKTGSFYYGPAMLYEVYHAAEKSSTPPFFNVIEGNNIAYDTSPGYNYPTGLGTPNLPYLYDVLYAAATKQ